MLCWGGKRRKHSPSTHGPGDTAPHESCTDKSCTDESCTVPRISLEDLCDPKVAELDKARDGEKEICDLEVAVDKPLAVEVSYSLAQLDRPLQESARERGDGVCFCVNPKSMGANMDGPGRASSRLAMERYESARAKFAACQ